MSNEAAPDPAGRIDDIPGFLKPELRHGFVSILMGPKTGARSDHYPGITALWGVLENEARGLIQGLTPDGFRLLLESAAQRGPLGARGLDRITARGAHVALGALVMALPDNPSRRRTLLALIGVSRWDFHDGEKVTDVWTEPSRFAELRARFAGDARLEKAIGDALLGTLQEYGAATSSLSRTVLLDLPRDETDHSGNERRGLGSWLFNIEADPHYNEAFAIGSDPVTSLASRAIVSALGADEVRRVINLPPSRETYVDLVRHLDSVAQDNKGARTAADVGLIALATLAVLSASYLPLPTTTPSPELESALEHVVASTFSEGLRGRARQCKCGTLDLGTMSALVEELDAAMDAAYPRTQAAVSTPAHLSERDRDSAGQIEESSAAGIDGQEPVSLPGHKYMGPIGRGGFGRVYRYRHVRLETDRAVKVFAPAFGGGTPKDRERFLREARNLVRLRHPYVIGAHDVGETAGGQPYMVLDYFHGKDLNARMSSGQQFDPAGALAIIVKVSEAIAHAHSNGVFHRDLKASNVLVGDDGDCRVIDFGLSIWIEAELEARLTATGEKAIGGRHMPPELLRTPKLANPQIDVFSIGVLWFQLLTGSQPGTEAASTLADTCRDLSPAYREAVRGCLADDPAARFADAAALLEALRTLRLGFASSGTAATSGAATAPAPDSREVQLVDGRLQAIEDRLRERLERLATRVEDDLRACEPLCIRYLRARGKPAAIEATTPIVAELCERIAGWVSEAEVKRLMPESGPHAPSGLPFLGAEDRAVAGLARSAIFALNQATRGERATAARTIQNELVDLQNAGTIRDHDRYLERWTGRLLRVESDVVTSLKARLRLL
jgi:hypothetical protein